MSIQGSPLFDLDRENTCPPTPVFEKKSQINPRYFDELDKNETAIHVREGSIIGNRIKTILAAAVSAILSLVVGFHAIAGLVILITAKGDKRLAGFVEHSVTTGVYGLILFLAFQFFCKCKEERRKANADIVALRNLNKQLVAERDNPVVVGHHVSCPCCKMHFKYILLGSQMPAGLQHCLACGKQFFTSQGYSYQLIYRGVG